MTINGITGRGCPRERQGGLSPAGLKALWDRKRPENNKEEIFINLPLTKPRRQDNIYN